MNLNRSTDAMDECAEHLRHVGASTGQIEAILTAYVSAIIYAEFEANIRLIVAERAARPNVDAHIISYSQIAAKRLIRSIKISELTGMLGYFDSSCKEKFSASLRDEAKNAWDSILNNRHNVAHENDTAAPISNLTLNDLKVHFENAKEVLIEFEAALR